MSIPLILSPKLHIIIPAAGIGSRMQPNQLPTTLKQPKQYRILNNGFTIIEETLNRFIQWHEHSNDFNMNKTHRIHKIYVALSPTDEQFQKLPISKHPLIQTYIGGNTRQASVQNAFQHLPSPSKTSWIMVHDAARCFIHPKDIENLYNTVLQHSPHLGGILAARSTDTLKNSQDGRHITGTLNRSQVWQAQTPQMFTHEILRKAYDKVDSMNIAITDDAYAIETLGEYPILVEAQYKNHKITYEHDLENQS